MDNQHTPKDLKEENTKKKENTQRNHNGQTGRKPAASPTPPLLLSSMAGHFLSPTDSSYDHSIVDPCLHHYYAAYDHAYGASHPLLKPAQLARVYGALDAAFERHGVTTVATACAFVDRHFARDHGKTDGNVNAFADPAVLQHIAYECERVDDV